LKGCAAEGLSGLKIINLCLETDGILYLNADPRLIAVWGHDFNRIRRDIEEAMRRGRQSLLATIDAYASIVDLWPQFPIEAMYPLLHAVANMDAMDQQRLLDWLLTRGQWSQSALVNAIILMLDFDRGEYRLD